jgi:hypothetical protein
MVTLHSLWHHKIMRDICPDCALILGVVWLWIGHFFTPTAFKDFQETLQWLTTAIVFVLACIRLWRVLVFRAPTPVLEEEEET